MGIKNVPDGRTERFNDIMDEIHVAYLTTTHPYATLASAVAAGDRLRAALHRILDAEYEQGCGDGAENATSYIRKHYELREIWD